jgi:hypothetical protein
MNSSPGAEGHAFISYVREDSRAADRVQRILEAANIRVWRDTGDLWPGEDWKLKIRQAITGDALAFIACFSDKSAARETTYQNEELLLAIDQLRQRQPDQAWLIPVRLSDCQLPQFDLGAGRTLDSLQRVDLFGRRWEEGSARLVAGVLGILGGQRGGRRDASNAGSVAALVKAALLDPARQIEVEDATMSLANEAFERLTDAGIFPTTSDCLTDDHDGLRFLVKQAKQYWTTTLPLADALIVGCAWGQRLHNPIWQRAIERVANSADSAGGQIALTQMRRYPILPLLYGGGLAALHRSNLSGLKALAIDARFRPDSGGRIPLIGAANVWKPFAHVEMTAQLLALDADGVPIDDDLITALQSRAKGKRHTPVSDLLHAGLREPLRGVIPDDKDYTETFDHLEALLALLAIDAKLEAHESGIYLDGAWYGSFTWRDRGVEPIGLEQRLRAEFARSGDSWPPLEAGLFGGSMPRAEAAFEVFIEESARARAHRW